MKIYTLVDSREIDRYTNCMYFKHPEDAEIMRDSMGDDKTHFDIHETEVIE